jgi:hypothetical protein
VLSGWSHSLDTFVSLYFMAFILVVQPAFYFNGDAQFRTNLANQGLATALYIALFY